MLLNIITLLFVILLVAQNGFGYGYNDCEQAQLSTQLEHGPSKSCEQKRRKGKGLVLATHRDGPHQQVNCIFRFFGSESFLSCNRCNDLQLSALNSRLICDATCSSGRTRLCGGCTSFSPCTRSCISQCLITSLLLKLALIRSYYLYNDY